MLYWTLKWVLISFVLIVLIHYLYSFLKTMLTIPKVRDLVNKPLSRYDEIITTKNITDNNYKNNNKNENDNENENENKNKNENNMQNELTNFLLDLKKPDNSDLMSNIVSANFQDNKSSFSSY